MSNIKQHSANGRNFLIVEVEKGYEDLRLSLAQYPCVDIVCDGEHGTNWVAEIGLAQEHDYQILFLASQATEEQAQMVVESSWTVCRRPATQYKNYYPQNKGGLSFASADWSLQSLIRSLFPDTHKTHDHLFIEILN